MAEDNKSWVYGDINKYVFDWLVAKPAPGKQALPMAVEDDGDEKRINALIAMLSADRGGSGNVVPFKSRKK